MSVFYLMQGNATVDPVEENNKAIARTELTNALSSITISDISSIKLISAALEGISSDSKQTTRDSAVIFLKIDL